MGSVDKALSASGEIMRGAAMSMISRRRSQPFWPRREKFPRGDARASITRCNELRGCGVSPCRSLSSSRGRGSAGW
jgi:hypothetical protein